MKGASETLNVILVLIIIGIFATLLFLTRMSGSRENIISLGESLQGQESKTLLNSLYAVHYPIVGADNEELMWVLRFGCAYGSPKEGEFVVSKSIPVIFNPKEFTENYLTEKLGENFYLHAKCPKNELKYGTLPPEGKEIISTKVMVPLPGGKYGEFYLMRWY